MTAGRRHAGAADSGSADPPDQPTLSFDDGPDGGAAVPVDTATGRSPHRPASDVRQDAEEAPSVIVRRSARRKRTVTAYREAGNIVVLIPQRMNQAEEHTYVQEMVDKVLARERKNRAPRGDDDLIRRAGELSRRYLRPLLGYSPVPVSVTWVANQNHRWGSCTPSAGTIRLSRRMLPMPSWVVDYVLLHELAHLAEDRHSARFWTLVQSYPSAEKAQGYLEGFQAGTGQAALDNPDTPGNAAGSDE